MVFSPTYLYIKQHTITGKLYLGKCSKSEKYMLNYKGSGVRWKSHIKYHGKDNVVTLWYQLYDNIFELVADAISMSKSFDIVNNESWLNLIPENGLDGNFSGDSHPMYGKKHSIERCQEISNRMSGQNNPMYGRCKELSPNYGKFGKDHPSYGKLSGKNNPMYGKCGELNPMYGKRGMMSPAYGRIHTEDTKRLISFSKINPQLYLYVNINEPNKYYVGRKYDIKNKTTRAISDGLVKYHKDKRVSKCGWTILKLVDYPNTYSANIS